MKDETSPQVAQTHNRRAWNSMVEDRHVFARPARDEQFRNPLAQVDGLGWLGPCIQGRRLLCLAAGGGRQGPLYAAAGAQVTVVDISPEMLALDREVAARRRLQIRTVEASMDDLSMFSSGEFEMVIQPVSTCYMPSVMAVYREVARITREGGMYVSQHKSPVSLQCEAMSTSAGYRLVEKYYRHGPLPQVKASRHREAGTLEFLHRWEELLGGMCRAGFVIEDLVEPMHADQEARPGTFAHRSHYVAPYLRIKARRLGTGHGINGSGPIWQPGI